MVLWHIGVIKKTIQKLKNLSLTTVAPVVLVLGGLMFNVMVLSSNNQQSEAFASPYLSADLGGVVGFESDSLFSDQVFIDDFDVASAEENTAGFVIVDGDSVLNSSNPLSTILPTRDGLLVYKVQSGDTLSKIAANFGISLNTIFWANKSLGNSIRPGQEIVILPVSGVAHQVDEGDSLESVAELYGVAPEKILQYNRGISPSHLRTGTSLVIPGAKPKKTFISILANNLPSLPGYFIMPTTGWNWGRLHNYNAVDIANACGTPIYAAAEGLVTRSDSYGWNEGYGRMIDIEHPNGVTTRYTHSQKNLVSVGDYVLQGDLIAYIGNTGKTDGPTGCHLHFEVHGARNPFAK
ncbi:MAG: hypothetical protein A2214_00585 [Candidatus Harrisonbacteria bacterium RIFOXYA1_FULL_48_8]|uniref:LysM domain-containing protein n=4 Tax=Parcubacteria group TaxID=1794811 RepID=A0A1G2FY72_9BACT|nr:MAG: hypothetical protein A3E64_01645 [Candidatus Harrisonbacteria bacterium RIFCSPHIGHO2_12_FULL_48_16]OGY69152.1 MAG: hypothetical protein A2214_00585 [Candidatus Harrisonbacteria bacterium RIFOXYA1_FULL_48_8]OGZ42511.1 MAG: hypothetical protein A2W41_00015 [Candidatus Ryanbacteria bacterium RIFCSPHIGHO2_01_45_13]